MPYRWLVTIIVIASAASPPADAANSESSSSPALDLGFLATHCHKCHADGVDNAATRLDDLPAEITTVELAERWQKVLNVLNAGEMPPEDATQPQAAAKREFLATLSQTLATARKTIGDGGRIATLRRLNRREYKNTLRDLLDAEVDVASLPDDQGGGNFDTFGSSLFMSSDQFEQYLAVARRAMSDMVDRWRRAAQPLPAVNTVRTEVEIAARRQMGGLLNGYFLGGYRKAKQWEAAGSDPAKASAFGFRDERAARFQLTAYEQQGPFLGQYLALPRSDEGAWLTPFIMKHYHHTEVISLPVDAYPGRYVLRLRVGGNENVPTSRRFLEMGIASDDDFKCLDVFQVTASFRTPELIEVPVTILADGPRSFSFREKRHADPAATSFHNSIAKATNGVGLDCALWIDWVEWHGPLPDDAATDTSLRLFGTAFPADPDLAAVRTILEHFATRAFRGVRPNADYIDRLVAIYDGKRAAGKAVAEALVEPLAVVLASPAFLYFGEPVSVTPSKDATANTENDRSLSDLELATRLSFFLWAAPPDEKLLAAAKAGSLRTFDGLAAQTKRLIADRRSFDLAKGFTHQWLALDRLDFFRFDYQLYPEFDESTREAAKEEIYHTFHMLLAENLDARKLLSNDFVVINGLLAAYYGLDDAGKPIQGMDYRKVALPAASPRGGLLGMAAVLGMGSNGERTSPVERGAWVLRKILNDPPPPAPPNVPQISRLDGQKISTRERLRLHQEQPQCAQCHRVIDPIGFGLENFDAAGKWRTEEHLYKNFNVVIKNGPHGKVVDMSFPIDPAGAFHNGPTFKNFFELRDRIAARGHDFLRGLIENLYAYALGRSLSLADADTIDGLVAEARANGGGVASIIQSIVATPEFRTK